MKKAFVTACCLLLLSIASCAPGAHPFADPADTALNDKVVAALQEYSATVFPSARGGRIYLDGELRNFNELQEVLSRVRAVPGVTDVVSNGIRLVEADDYKDKRWN